MTTFLLIVGANKKINLLVLVEILYIYYLIWFKKKEMQALINWDSKVNIIILRYNLKLSFKVCYTNIKA